MKWSKELPSAPGYYWHNEPWEVLPGEWANYIQMVQLCYYSHNGVAWVETEQGEQKGLQDMKGWFSERIKQPSDFGVVPRDGEEVEIEMV